MSWASHHTREMAISPPGRHRRRRRPILPPIAGATLLVLLVVAAMFAPALFGLPPPERLSGAAAPIASPTPRTSPTTTTATPTPAKPTPTPAATSTPARTTPPPTARLSLPDEPGNDPELVALEDAVFELTNKERQKAECPTLRMDERLRKAARLHSADMIHSGYFDHTSPDGRGPGERLADAGYPADVGWAENIASGYPSAAAVMDGWMGSSGHRANILDCRLKAIGVGVARTGSGRLYWTQDFGGR